MSQNISVHSTDDSGTNIIPGIDDGGLGNGSTYQLYRNAAATNSGDQIYYGKDKDGVVEPIVSAESINIAINTGGVVLPNGWTFAGDFSYADWQPNNTNSGLVNIPLDANELLVAVAIVVTTGFTGGSIDNTSLRFHNSVNSNVFRFFGLGALNTSGGTITIFSTNQVYGYIMGDGGRFNFTNPYNIQVEIQTNSGVIDDLTAGEMEIWIKTEKLPPAI